MRYELKIVQKIILVKNAVMLFVNFDCYKSFEKISNWYGYMFLVSKKSPQGCFVRNFNITLVKPYN